MLTDANELVANASQLAKEDEKADEVEVRREDQDKINRFSRLHQRELALNEELKTKNVRRRRDKYVARNMRTSLLIDAFKYRRKRRSWMTCLPSSS